MKYLVTSITQILPDDHNSGHALCEHGQLCSFLPCRWPFVFLQSHFWSLSHSGKSLWRYFERELYFPLLLPLRWQCLAYYTVVLEQYIQLGYHCLHTAKCRTHEWNMCKNILIWNAQCILHEFTERQGISLLPILSDSKQDNKHTKMRQTLKARAYQPSKGLKITYWEF